MTLIEISMASGIGVLLCALSVHQTTQVIDSVSRYRERAELMVHVLEGLHLMNDTVSSAKRRDQQSGLYRVANSSAIDLKQKGQFVIRKGVASIHGSDAFYVYTSTAKDKSSNSGGLVGFFVQQQGYGRARENLLYMVRESQKNKLYHHAIASGVHGIQIQLGVWQDAQLIWLEPHEIHEKADPGHWGWSDVIALQTRIEWRWGRAQIDTHTIWASFQQ